MISKKGFTLVELILAITIMAAIAVTTYFSFEAGTRAWRSGMEVSDSLHHADFVLEQLAMGLRSATYPDAPKPVGQYGMILEDNGDDHYARDTLSWVKSGTALVGSDSPIADTPHRVEVTVLEPGTSDIPELKEGGLAIKAWRMLELPDDIDPREEARELILTTRVIGFNCRILDPEDNLKTGKPPGVDDDLNWDVEWIDDYTNRLPHAVEISLYFKPARERDQPIEVKRIVELPLAPLSWRDKGAAGGQFEIGAQTQNQGRRQRNPSGTGRVQSGQTRRQNERQEGGAARQRSGGTIRRQPSGAP